jgi:large subunit ribosomal protein L7/L12
MAIVTTEDILETLESMTLKQVNELVKAIEEKFGVSAAPVAVAAAPAAGGAAAPAAEEKTEFTVVLAAVDAAAKIKVIKEIRTITNLGLKEAKDLVEAAPTTVLKDVPKDEAEKAKAALEAAGAKVEIK